MREKDELLAKKLQEELSADGKNLDDSTDLDEVLARKLQSEENSVSSLIKADEEMAKKLQEKEKQKAAKKALPPPPPQLPQNSFAIPPPPPLFHSGFYPPPLSATYNITQNIFNRRTHTDHSHKMLKTHTASDLYVS